MESSVLEEKFESLYGQELGTLSSGREQLFGKAEQKPTSQSANTSKLNRRNYKRDSRTPPPSAQMDKKKSAAVTKSTEKTLNKENRSITPSRSPNVLANLGSRTPTGGARTKKQKGAQRLALYLLSQNELGKNKLMGYFFKWRAYASKHEMRAILNEFHEINHSLHERVLKEGDFRNAVRNLKNDFDTKLATINQFVNVKK